MRTVYLFLLILFLSSCSLIPPPPTMPPVFVSPQPSTTPTLVPSPTSTPITPTLPPTPTPDLRFFRDEFIETLDPQWSWIREDPQNWSLTNLPGSLQINIDRGYIYGHNYSNLLLRPAPEGNFQIETQITFRPTRDYQFAGLIIYEDDSKFIQAGRGYCSSIDCPGAGLYMNYYKNGVIVEPDFRQTYREIDPLVMRLSRKENTYTFEASPDGKVWFIVGSHTSNINPAQIGLVTGQLLRGALVPATFEYFEVRSLP